jgi:hypothetical protein
MTGLSVGTIRHVIELLAAALAARYLRFPKKHAPLCRRHHRMKQRQGWRLEQPAPGILR